MAYNKDVNLLFANAQYALHVQAESASGSGNLSYPGHYVDTKLVQGVMLKYLVSCSFKLKLAKHKGLVYMREWFGSKIGYEFMEY